MDRPRSQNSPRNRVHVSARHRRGVAARRAAGLARTLIVASSTFATLVILFAIFQSTQPATVRTRSAPRPRLPEPTPVPGSQTINMDPKDVPGLAVPGGGVIGPGRKTTLTLYGETGDRPRAEILLDEWTPIEGSPNTLWVRRPEIRLRTKSGNGIRAVSRTGTLETTGDISGKWTLRRGRLEGNVVIEIDRLTDNERQALPEGERDIDGSQVIRIEADAIEFDREFAKLTIEGPVRLIASDVEVSTSNVEIRFNESAGRVEYCRIKSAGRIVLKQSATLFGVQAPKLGGGSKSGQTIVDWIRTTIERRAALSQRQGSNKPSPGQTPLVTDSTPDQGADSPSGQTAWRGMPVFHARTSDDDAEKRPLYYRALFKGTVDVRQSLHGEQVSRLQADVLDILRGISDRQGDRMRKTQPAAATSTAATDEVGATTDDERIVITWSDRLEVTAVELDDAEPDIRSHVRAEGNPVRLTSREGSAICQRLEFDPDRTQVELTGSESLPVSVYSAETGLIRGRRIETHEEDEQFVLHVEGPGQLMRGAKSWDIEDALTASVENPESGISFERSLNVQGKTVTRTRLGLNGRILTTTQRRIEKAVFDGRSVFRDQDTALHADHIEVDFARSASTGGMGQDVRSVRGVGNVLLVRSADRITCDRMDVTMTRDAAGKNVPQTATAYGNVVAIQGTRRIRATDQMTVDFASIERPARALNAIAAYHAAIAAGEDPLEIDWDARRRAHEQRLEHDSVVSRLQASGDVEVVDPRQQVHIVGDSIDCLFEAESKLQRAVIHGTAQRPCSAKLGALTVVGAQVSVDLQTQDADVPGAGTMTLLSRKDLSGRKLDTPIPITISWQRDMRFRGAANQAVFSGNVHASSEDTTTFDCAELLVDFIDVDPAPTAPHAADWWILGDVFSSQRSAKAVSGSLGAGQFAKEPSYVLATGNAVAITSDLDPTDGTLVTRARIAGPKLSVDLSEAVSRMLIEGAGTLLMEDFRDPTPGPARSAAPDAGLFNLDNGAGPSKTLIEWKDAMWYDFAAGHTQFAGKVSLKHFSGQALKRRFAGSTAADIPGRSTFLECDQLTASFDSAGSRRERRTRMGGLSAVGLLAFQALGAVRLHDEVLALWLNADRIAFQRDLDTLSVYGTSRRPARLVQQRAGELPTDMKARRFYYNTRTGKIEAQNPFWEGR